MGSGNGAPTITVSSLHITSAQPAGNSGATVRFTVKAEASLDGQDLQVLPQGPGSEQWLATTEVAGHWYVNLDDSTALAFGGGCACDKRRPASAVLASTSPTIRLPIGSDHFCSSYRF